LKKSGLGWVRGVYSRKASITNSKTGNLPSHLQDEPIMSRYFDRISSFIPLYRLVEVTGRVGIMVVAISSAGTALAQAWSPSCAAASGNGYGQADPALLAAPPCGVHSYARIWLKPGCRPPSFCKFRCCECTHIWDGYCNQQSEKLNRQLARQLYYLQKEHIARGWPWNGGCYGQPPCPGFGPEAMGYGTNGPQGMGPGGTANGPYPGGMPPEGEGHAEVISDEAIEEGPVESSGSPTLTPVPAEPSSSRIKPLPPLEKFEPGESDGA
jgi:hypothetical protein